MQHPCCVWGGVTHHKPTGGRMPHSLARWKHATTLWRQPSWLPVNAASLLRLGKSDTSYANGRQNAALTGTLEACRHTVEATILVASECSILAAFGENRRIM